MIFFWLLKWSEQFYNYPNAMIYAFKGSLNLFYYFGV